MSSWLRIGGLCLLIAISFLTGSPGNAQTPPPAEPDTEAFIEDNFRLQTTYSGVLCVEQDDPCPAEVTVSVPCLTAACAHPTETYPVQETFTTLQAAVEAAAPGNLITIMPGRYQGVEVEDSGGQDEAYIHFLGWGEPGSVIVDRPADPDKSYLRHHFYFINAHHFIIQNIAFEGAADGAGIFFSGYFSYTGQFAHHVIIKDVYSHHHGEWGLHTTATSYVLVEDSVFSSAQEEHGVYLSGSGDYLVVRRNVFQDNEAAGIQINADPQTATAEIFYWLENSTGETCGWTEDDVEFEGDATWDDLKACYDEQGLPDLGEFIEDGISQHIIIEQNIATANGRAGGAAINLASVRDTTIRNNLLYGNAAAAIACWDNAYAEEKGLPSSDFGCQDVRIINNTLVDRSGNRGALILNNDARDVTVFNNIIIRDRFDAYEIANRSGTGLRAGHNYHSNRYIDNAPNTPAEENSQTGFTVDEGLAHFVNPSFAPWVLEGETWWSPNPDRPDFRLRADSALTTAGQPAFGPTLDLLGNQRTQSGLGALVAAGDENTQ